MDHWFNRYAVLALGAAVGLAGYTWIDWRCLTVTDWGTWVGAIGTVGALAGTIWIATSESRRRQQQAVGIAGLVCLAMSNDLQWLLDQLAVVSALEGNLDLGGREEWRGIADAISKRAQWSNEELNKLICLGDGTAERMALGQSQVAGGTISLRAFASTIGTTASVRYRKEAITQLFAARDNFARASHGMLTFVERQRR